MIKKEQIKKEINIVDSIQEFFDLARVDLTNIAIGYHDSINLDFEFPLSPDKYLQFAKSDFRDGSEKGLINALSNAKRSIDCLVESVLYSLNINPNSIPDNANVFFNDVLSNAEKKIAPKSLKLFCALGFAPSILISEVRSLRNKVEHDYVIPKKSDVIKAIEVADLLLNNVKAKEIYSATIDITDLQSQKSIDRDWGTITGIYFSERFSKRENGICKFTLEYFSKDNRLHYNFEGNEIIYFYLLRSMFTAAHDEEILEITIKSMFNHIDTRTPREHIKIAQIHR